MLKQLGDVGICKAYHQLMYVVQGRIAMEPWIHTEKHGFSKKQTQSHARLPRINSGKYVPFIKITFRTE